MADILVVGSVNADLVVRTPRLPQRGETVDGVDFALHSGGKGANQAVAAARLGGKVALWGRVGDDPFGARLRDGLAADGIDVSGLVTDPEHATGVALIEVEEQSGENRIVLVRGANAHVAAAELEPAFFRGARLVLLQLEVPLDTVRRAAELAQQAGARVLLDPAPAVPLPEELLALADWVLPNEHEAQFLTGVAVEDAAGARRAAAALRRAGAARAVVKLGARGAFLDDGERRRLFPGHRVATVDATAAGDCFAGALAVALVEGKTPGKAVEFANRAAALSTTRPGAQESWPRRREVEEWDPSLMSGCP